MTGSWLRRIEALDTRARALAVLALFAVMVTVDGLTGLDLTLRALYLLPVAAAAWLLHWRAGALVAILSVAASTSFDVALGLGATHAGFVYSDTAVRLVVYLAAAYVLAQLRAAQSRLAELAETDPLTGLYNRRGLRLVADHEIERSRRAGASLTLAHLDLDGFKALNDTRGHAEGDEVLRTVGQVLKSSRRSDVAARLGGDEFALLLPDTDARAATGAVGHVVARLNDAMSARGWPVTFSVGVATSGDAPGSLDEMLAVADALTYEVKRAGKGGVRYRELEHGGVSTALLAPSATRRILFLDYDGTLVPFAATPDQAAPDAELLALLGALAARADTRVHLVSGRSRASLDAWLGALPVVLHAEHGLWRRDAPDGAWSARIAIQTEWMDEALKAIAAAVAAAPGSFVERKSAAIAWHYRLADSGGAEAAGATLRAALAPLLHAHHLEVLEGACVLEVRVHGANKGLAVGELERTPEAGTLLVAIGDDTTDEDLFAALPADAVTVHVGGSPSNARYTVASPDDVRVLLRRLRDAPSRPPRFLGDGERAWPMTSV